ncbi:MAG: glycosyltransferase [Ferruginibacter sp.]
MMYKDLPLVTVGIPTYNRAAGLERTLQCIVQQTYTNLQVIVSDNCSTDDKVLPVLQKYAAADNRVKFHVQEKNISIVPNFQYLLDQASGEFFMWAADDDHWDANFIEVCVNGLLENKDAVVAIGDVKIVNLANEKKDTKLTHGFMENNLYNRLFNWIRSDGETKYFFCGLYRSSAIKNIPFQNNWGGDHMFLLEAITKGKFLYIPGSTNFYYFRGGSSTTSDRIKKAFNIKSKYFYTEGYVLRYAWYHFRFDHLSVLQKIGLLFSNSAGLLFNKEKILYYALIKKPFMDLKSFIRNKMPGSKHKATYDQDGLRTLHNNGFMSDPDFVRAEKAGAATGSWNQIHWRVHTILWTANQCINVEGDFVECGTNKGGFARAIVEYVDLAKAGKSFYLLDTFEGLSEKLFTDEEKAAGRKEHFEHVYKNCYEEVLHTFAAFPFVKIIKGTVPGTLEEVKSEKIAFLSVDMNSVVPEIAALDHFWDKLSKGGMIVLDDYAFVTCDLQYKAHNEWAKEKGIKILTLPTGQGLIVK